MKGTGGITLSELSQAHKSSTSGMETKRTDLIIECKIVGTKGWKEEGWEDGGRKNG